MHLLRDSTSNARWLEDNINDFSLTSLLGHLDEIDATRDILVSQNACHTPHLRHSLWTDL